MYKGRTEIHSTNCSFGSWRHQPAKQTPSVYSKVQTNWLKMDHDDVSVAWQSKDDAKHEFSISSSRAQSIFEQRS